MCTELLGIERYNISAVFLLFYFADDLVSEKNGETQTFFLWKRSENDDIIMDILCRVVDTRGEGKLWKKKSIILRFN